MFLLPLRPYVPVGTLRRAATYPDSLESHRLEAIAEAFERVGLGHLADKLDEEAARDPIWPGALGIFPHPSPRC
jgi:putative ATP-binding cassette transporter